MSPCSLHHSIWPAAALTAGVAFTLFAWRLTTGLVADKERERFGFCAREKLGEVSHAVDTLGHLLSGGAGLFAVSDVTRDAWRSYVGSLRQDAHSSCVQALGFGQRLASGELEAHVRQVRAEGFPDYTVLPEGGRAEYVPVTYLEPSGGGEPQGLGYDMFSEPVRRAAMERARDTGRTALSGKVALARKGVRDTEPGFLMYTPVYRRGMPAGTVEERRAALRGYVYTALVARDFLSRAFPAGLRVAHLQVFDGRGTEAESLLFDSLGQAGKRPRAPHGLSEETTVESSGRAWTIRVSATPAFENRAERVLPRTVLAGGIVLSFAFGLVVWLEQRARSKAKQLQQSEAHLAATLLSIGEGVLSTDTDGRVTALNTVAERLTGWTSAEARGRPVAEVFRIVNEKTRQPAAVPLNDVLASGTIKGPANHTALIARDGAVYPIAHSAAPILNAHGGVAGAVLIFRDITEQRRTEDERNRFFALASDMLCLAGTDGLFKRVNPAFSQTLGWTETELLARPFLDLVHPDDLAATRHAMETLADGEPVADFANRYRCKDGTWRWLSWRSAAQGDGTIYATARDVTDQKTVEEAIVQLNATLEKRVNERTEALSRAKQDWERTYDAVPDMIAIIGTDYRIIRANRALAERLGVQKDDLVGQFCYACAHGTSEPPPRCPHRELLADGQPHAVELYEPRLGCFLDIQETPLRDEAGVLTGSVHVVRDITERKRTEEQTRIQKERLDRASSASRTALWDWDIASGALEWSGVVDAMLGFDPGGFPRGIGPWEDAIHPEDRTRVAEVLNCHLERGAPYEVSYRMRRRDGSYVWWHDVGQAVLDESGRAVAMYGACVDITERKRAEESLRKLSAQLCRAEEDERRRIARELHDSTGQKLAALSMTVRLLQAAPRAPDSKTDTMFDSCMELIGQCVKDVRTVSYLLHPPLLDEIGLTAVIRDYANGFSKRSGIQVALDVPTDQERLPPEIEFNLFRMVQESLGNIHRHAGATAARVCLISNEDEAVLEVGDNGRGIDDERLRVLRTGTGMSGVGIAGMRERLRLLGGRLEIESDAHGTAVRAVIPLREEAT